MKRIKIISLFCTILMFFACSSEKEKLQSISVTMVSNLTVKFGSIVDAEIEFSVKPDEVLESSDIMFKLTDAYGNPSTNFELTNIRTFAIGRVKGLVHHKTKSIQNEKVNVCVVSQGVMGLSAPIDLVFQDALLTSFSLNGYQAEIDNAKKTITLNVPYLVDVSSVIPIFSASSGILYFQDKPLASGNSTIDLTNDKTVTLVSGDLSYDYTIVIKNSGLPVVSIYTPNEQDIKSKVVWMEGASMTIQMPDGSLDYEGTLSVKGRGNSTWWYVKKPYALKLDKKSKILGMSKHKRWCLLANWMDRTLMRNAVSFEIARYTSLDWTPQGQFVELILNGKHLGNYYLCEQIKVDPDRVNIAELDPNATSGDAITGGYIFEIDDYYDEVNKFMSPKFNLPWQFKDPDEVNNAQINYIKNYVAELEYALTDETRFANREFTEYIDLQSFVDWWIVYELAQNWEPNHPKSCYMHKDINGKIKAGPVWDFDWGTYYPQTWYWFTIIDALYYKPLFKDAKFRALAKERWNALKNKLATIPEFIDQTAEHIAVSEASNHKLWPIDSANNGDEQLSFPDAVERLKKAYLGKFEYMDKEIKKW